MKSALVVGATGAVGNAIVKQLLDDERYDKIVVLSRRELAFSSSKLQVEIVDFDEISKLDLGFFDEVFCTLGTTIKQAKSRENFIKVDFYYPLELAKIAKKAGAKKFILISSANANSNSKNFYLQTKGRAEDAIASLNFDILHIAHLPLIDVVRADVRLGERFFIWLLKCLPSRLLKILQPITPDRIAKAVLTKAQDESLGTYKYFIFEILS